ncbi:hypothetical protein [Undibacterium sp. Ren11W]|uniref:hypothetical protein n=1 Tax=Undibacterium sp. Ren11W TaxID=3413045 RepID=UPI003BF0EBAE
MNTLQVRGFTKNILGIVQECLGIFFGIQDQQSAGRQKQSLGTAEKNLGDARDLINTVLKQMQRSEQSFQILSNKSRIHLRPGQNVPVCTNSITYLKKLN